MKRIILCLCLMLMQGIVWANDEGGKQALLKNDGLTVTSGVALVHSPAFLGAKDYYTQMLPVIRINYKDKFFASLDEGVGYNLINDEKWSVGPILKYSFARSDKDSDGMFRVAGDKTTALNGLDKVGSSWELGGFAEYTFLEHFKFYGELRQAVNGHEGFRSDWRLNYENQFGYVMYSFGPKLSIADERYHDAYFGISDAVAARTGLRMSDPDGGILTYGFGGRVIVPFSTKIAAVLFGSYDHLGHESAESSLVKERGSAHSVTAGIALVYRWQF